MLSLNSCDGEVSLSFIGYRSPPSVEPVVDPGLHRSGTTCRTGNCKVQKKNYWNSLEYILKYNSIFPNKVGWRKGGTLYPGDRCLVPAPPPSAAEVSLGSYI